jgi:S-adenosyl-L-methionine hydrolase (adenosine-forming)
VRAAFELVHRRWWLPKVAATFHGRDVFAPVAAWLATGVDAARMGPPLPPAQLVRLPAAVSIVDDAGMRGEVVLVDRFGNVQLAVPGGDLPPQRSGPVRVWVGDREWPAQWVSTFGAAPAGALVVLVDSAGWLAVAVNGGSAAQQLGVTRGDVVRIELVR